MRTTGGCRAQSSERILRICFVAVKEVLRVIHQACHASCQIAHRVFYDLKVLFGAETQRVCDMQQPRLAEDRYDGRFRLEQRLNAWIVVAGKRMATGRSECGNSSVC